MPFSGFCVSCFLCSIFLIRALQSLLGTTLRRPQLITFFLHFKLCTHNRLTTLCLELPGRPVHEETLTHSHPSWSSDIFYQLPPSTTIHSILVDQSTYLTVFFHNLSAGPLCSTSLSGRGLPSSSYSLHFSTQLLSSRIIFK